MLIINNACIIYRAVCLSVGDTDNKIPAVNNVKTKVKTDKIFTLKLNHVIEHSKRPLQ